MGFLLHSDRSKVIEKKLTNNGPLIPSAAKHSIYTIKKWQLVVEEGNEDLTAAELFYSLAA
jgi:hypothetical protein